MLCAQGLACLARIAYRNCQTTMGRLIALGLLLVVLQVVRGADQCDATGPRKDCGASDRHCLASDHGYLFFITNFLPFTMIHEYTYLKFS